MKITLNVYRGDIFSREFVSDFCRVKIPRKEFWMLHQLSPQYRILY